jgi:uncharacterized protein (DUF1778 family)
MTVRKKPKNKLKGETVRLRLTAGEKALWTKAADAAGRDLSNWLRYVANRCRGSASRD